MYFFNHSNAFEAASLLKLAFSLDFNGNTVFLHLWEFFTVELVFAELESWQRNNF